MSTGKPIMTAYSDIPSIPTVTSLSGGKSSSYMALHWPTDYILFALVLTSDPAMAPKDSGILKEVQRRIPGFVGTTEVELTLLNLLKLEQKLGREVTWVCAYEGQSRPKFISDSEWLPKPLTFDRTIKCRGGLPDKTKRWCTTELKILAIYWHCFLHIFKSPEDMVWMNIGYRADEQRRLTALQQCKANTVSHPILCPVNSREKRAKHRHRHHEWRIPNCPMIKAGITQRQVLDYWSNQGWSWPEVSNCAHCFFHTDFELQRTANLYPNHINWAIQQEALRNASWDSRQTLSQRISAQQPELFPTREFSCLCTD